jgi:hypothetical protein
MMYCSFGGSEICVWKKSVLECNPERAGQPDPMRRTVKMQQQRRLEHWLLSRHRLAEVAEKPPQTLAAAPEVFFFGCRGRVMLFSRHCRCSYSIASIR